MNEEFAPQVEQQTPETEATAAPAINTAEAVPAADGVPMEAPAAAPKLTKKKIVILSAIAAAVVVLGIVAFAVFHKSEFQKVRDECVQIAGIVTGDGDYFTLDTCPDSYDNMDSTLKALLLPGAQENALKAIKYANEALGFNGSVYNKMLQTSALMGRQREENSKYVVTWTYSPSDGLEVTYEKK